MTCPPDEWGRAGTGGDEWGPVGIGGDRRGPAGTGGDRRGSAGTSVSIPGHVPDWSGRCGRDGVSTCGNTPYF